MNIRIRLLLDSEYATVNEVYNEAYGNIRPLDSFKWEFVNGPWGKAIYVIAEDLEKQGNKIIGTQSAIPMVFINGKGETVLTAKSEDTFVHPDYRGHKLYKYLTSLNESNGLKEKAKILALVLASRCNSLFHSLKVASKINYFKSDDYSLKKKVVEKNLLANTNLWSIHQTQKYLDWRLKLNPFANNYLQFSDHNENDLVNSAVLVNYRKEGFAYIEEINFVDKSSFNSCLQLTRL